jgi:tetratricopeptide (TPR) repeat protein
MNMFQGETEYEFLGYWKSLADCGESRTPSIEEAYRPLLQQEGAAGSGFVELLLRLVRLLRYVGEWDSAEQRARQALALVDELDDHEHALAACSELGNLLLMRGFHDEAIACYQRQQKLAEASGNTRALADSIAAIGAIHLERAEYPQATESYNRALQLYEQSTDHSGAARACGKIGQIHLDLKEYPQAMHWYKRSLQLAESIGDRRVMAFALGQIGLLHWNQGQYDEAMKYYDREKSTVEELGDTHGVATSLGKIGLVHLDRDDLNEAERCFNAYLDQTTMLGYARGVGYALGNLGTVELRRDNYDAAMDYFNRALATHRDLNFPSGVWLWLKWKAETVLKRVDAGEDVSADELTEALEWAGESQRIVQDISGSDAAADVGQLIERINTIIVSK